MAHAWKRAPLSLTLDRRTSPAVRAWLFETGDCAHPMFFLFQRKSGRLDSNQRPSVPNGTLYQAEARPNKLTRRPFQAQFPRFLVLETESSTRLSKQPFVAAFEPTLTDFAVCPGARAVIQYHNLVFVPTRGGTQKGTLNPRGCRWCL